MADRLMNECPSKHVSPLPFQGARPRVALSRPDIATFSSSAWPDHWQVFWGDERCCASETASLLKKSSG